MSSIQGNWPLAGLQSSMLSSVLSFSAMTSALQLHARISPSDESPFCELKIPGFSQLLVASKFVIEMPPSGGPMPIL